MKSASLQAKVILRIAARAESMAAKAGVIYPRIEAALDIEAVHARQALRLEELYAADDGNFSHDVFGIRRHLDRGTRELRDCFLPRFTI